MGNLDLEISLITSKGKMKQLSKIKFLVKGQKYKLYSSDEIPDSIAGLCDVHKKEITINPNANRCPNDVIHTLIHEISHSVIHEVSLDQAISREIEEVIVDNIASVVTDNLDSILEIRKDLSKRKY